MTAYGTLYMVSPHMASCTCCCLRVDEEDFGGHNELLGEGVQGSSSVFMVSDGMSNCLLVSYAQHVTSISAVCCTVATVTFLTTVRCIQHHHLHIWSKCMCPTLLSVQCLVLL